MPETSKQARDTQSEVVALRKRSHQWMAHNFYDQWVQAYKSYKCERDPERDSNDSSKEDPTQTSLGMPDTWSVVNRQVARITAQPPNLRFLAKDRGLAEKISRKLMYDWDRGNVQRQQKKHVRQACLFGWSVRAWSWGRIEHPRKRRVDPFAASQKDMEDIRDQFGPDLAGMRGGEAENMAALLSAHGRPGEPPTLSLSYQYKKYEGPRADFVFVGDAFPEPNFSSIQESGVFIVRRRRNKKWLETIAKTYGQLAAGVAALLNKHPNGTSGRNTQDDAGDLFRKLEGAVGRTEDLAVDMGIDQFGTKMWTVWEAHFPGEDAKLVYLGEDELIGTLSPYPYDLDGKVAFTEMVLIDDLLSGVGDSNARIIRGLQLLHDRQVNKRWDLIDAVQRPLIGTSSRKLFENPGLVKRGKGFRLVLLGGEGEVWPIGDHGAIAGAAAGLQDEESIHRNIQQATGESNMSLMANVDPGQNRTATGARLMAYQQDVLTKDAVDMFLQTSINPDAEMMYLLNRSEMPEAIEFDASRLNRQFSSTPGSATEPQMMTVTPLDFQIDGEVEAEAGSTLADDDEAKVQQAQNLFAAAVGNPTMFNTEKARETYLISMGKGRELPEWAAPPPAPPPTAEPVKESISVSMKFELLPPVVQRAILERSELVAPGALLDGIDPPASLMAAFGEPPAGPAGPAPEPGGGPPAPGHAPPPLPPTGGREIGAAQAAATGRA